MLKINWKGVNILPWVMAAAGVARNLIRRKGTMEKVDINKLAEEVISDLADLKAEAKAVKSVKDALKILPAVIKKVEEVAGGVALAGAEKKELAVAVINKLVDIPWVPESAEAYIIGLGIDAAVAALNRLLGTSWLEKVA
jgi:hypothetical protein